jgi:hypothetical protein
VDSIGYTHVVGEVQNIGTQNLDFIQLTATFYASNSSVVDTGLAYTLMSILTPGQKSPFDVTTARQNVIVDHFSLSVSDASVTTDQPNTKMKVQGATSHADQIGYYHVVGEVTNIGTTTANNVKVIVTYYDSAGKVVDVGFTFTSPANLQAGETGSFDSSTNHSVNTISSFVVQVQDRF